MDENCDWVYLQDERVKSYKFWPFKKGACCPEKMAEAGFYAIGNKNEPDHVRCYVCLKELDGWEKEDDPWLEHKKHAPRCPFVLLDKKPKDFTVQDVLTLQNESVKRKIVVDHEKKVKLLDNLKDIITTEISAFSKKSVSKPRRGKSSRSNI